MDWLTPQAEVFRSMVVKSPDFGPILFIGMLHFFPAHPSPVDVISMYTQGAGRALGPVHAVAKVMVLFGNTTPYLPPPSSDPGCDLRHCMQLQAKLANLNRTPCGS